MTDNFCELCGSRGLRSKLVARQLNFEEAIIVCENEECVYPLVGTWQVSGSVVKRKASEVSNLKRKKRRKVQKARPKVTDDMKTLTTESISVQEEVIQWQNKSALCWLDCAIALVVHNRTIINCLSKPNGQTDSVIGTLLNAWISAQALKSREKKYVAAAKVLEEARDLVWHYLQPNMKCELGVNDTPVAALPLLFRENLETRDQLLQEYRWEFSCSVCGYKQVDRHKKYVITFPNTTTDFSLTSNASFLRPCYKCGALSQRSHMVFNSYPTCILLHFMEGLKTTECLEREVCLGNDDYSVSQLIQYRRDPDHFIFWTKEPNGTRWMEMDDLKPSVCTWSMQRPTVLPEQLHIVVWEKTCSRNPDRPGVCVELPTPAQCANVSSVRTDVTLDSNVETAVQRKRKVRRPPPLVLDGMLEELTSLDETRANSSILISEPLLRDSSHLRTQTKPAITDTQQNGHPKLGNNYSGSLKSTAAVSVCTPVVTKNMSDTLKSTTAVGTPTVAKGIADTLKSATARCTSALAKSTPDTLKPSTSTASKGATDNLSLAGRASAQTHTNREVSLKRKLAAAKFEPYIPGKHKSVTVSCPNSPLAVSSVPKYFVSPALDSPVGTSKSAAFLSWQDVAEDNKRAKFLHDNHSDSGYSSPASVSSCSSLSTLSDCSVSENRTSELQQDSSSILPTASQGQVASDSSNQFQCSTLANELEELLLDCIDNTSTSTAITKSTVESASEFPVDLNRGHKELSQEDDDFILDLVCS